jgi:hypothetical protein
MAWFSYSGCEEKFPLRSYVFFGREPVEITDQPTISKIRAMGSMFIEVEPIRIEEATVPDIKKTSDEIVPVENDSIDESQKRKPGRPKKVR